MFQSAGLFKDVSCPYFLYGLCERPHCHFKHSKQEEAKARKEADAGKKETESDEGYALPTSSLQRTLQAIEDNIKSEKKKLSTKDEPGEENKVTKSDKKVLKNKPTGTPEYNPTPIQELKKKKIQGKLGRSKYDLALLQKPETDSEYDPECNFSTNGNTGHSGEGTVPDYAKSLHGVKRTVDENDEDGSPLAKIPKFVSVDYMPSVIETEVSDDELIGEKEDWFSENESRNSNDSGNIESSEEKPKDNGDADETPSEKNSLPIEFTPEGFVKYVPTKIDNKKKDSKGDAKDGKPSLNGIVFPNDSKEKDTNKESDSTHTKKRDPCSYNIFSLFKNEFDKVFEDSESSKDNDKTRDKSHRKSSESEHKINEKKPRGCHSEKHTNNHKHQSKDKGDSHSSGSKDRSSSKEKNVTSNHGSSSSKHSSSSSKHSSSTSKSSSSSSKESGSLSKHSSSKHSSSSSKHSSSSSRERSSSSKLSSSKHSSSSSKDTRPSPSSSTSKHDKHKNSKLERSDGSKSSSGKNHRESHSTDRDSKKLSKPSKKSIVNLDVDLFGEDVLNMSNNHNDDDDMSDLEKYFEEDPFEECLRIFNEDKNNGSTKTDKKKMKKSSTVEDAPPPVVVGKKRIALKENEDKAKRQKVDDKPKPKPSPAQVMMNRYKMMQERALLAEQERKEKVKAKVKEMQAGRMANPPPPVAGPNIAGSISTFTTYMNNKNKKTAAITVAKGAKRKAHTPTVEIEKLKRPAVQMTSSTKVPANVRQRYLNLFIDECLKLCRTEREAYDKGKAEEEAAFNRCSNKKIDLNIVVHTIKRLRTEIEEKKARKNAPKKEAKLSHAAMLGGAHAKNTSFTLNRSGGAVKLREEDFKGAELYNCLKSYILTEEQLNMNNFPRPDPAKGGCAVYLGEVNNAQKGSVKGYEKICIRCGKRFEVYPNGKYPKKEECVYHWGKAWKKKVAGTIDTRYTCCSGDLSAEGCQVARAHVHETNKKENLSGFMKTIPCSPPIDGDYGVYAMDCEMVYTTMGMELARVTVVDGDGEVAYESLVQPDNPVVDCNTRFSGITDEDLEDVSTSLRDVQAVLLCLFTDKAILLGHRLESDLTAVKLIHSTVVDTSIVFPHRMGLPYKRALINLMIEYLKKIIQDDVAGYDSHEDALACLQLMQYKLKEDDRKEASDKEKVTSEMKYDMGWQKRGSKRSYDSRSGVGTLISNTTGKVCAYGIRSKDCRVCTLHHNKGTPVSTHKCYKNWKGMEPDVGNETLTKESREGITYQPGVANSHIGEIIAIPGPGLIPEPKPIEQFLPTEKFVFCDIETTSLSANADIVQIAAVCENDTFNQYICPQQQISYQASEVTGLKVIGGNLFYKGNIVETVALMEALKSFLNFLEKKGLCILIGHNFKRFDFPRLLRSFELCSLIDSLQNKTKGIVDTLPLFKEVYPGLRRYGQEFIVSTIMQDSYDSHNALADVESLQKLFTASNIPQDIILKFSIGIKSAIEQNEYKKTCETNLETLQILIKEQVLSKSMAEKVAKSGLQFSHLKVAVNHSGLGGLTNVLGEKIKGKPRVTCRKSILKSLFNYFKTNEQ